MANKNTPETANSLAAAGIDPPDKPRRHKTKPDNTAFWSSNAAWTFVQYVLNGESEDVAWQKTFPQQPVIKATAVISAHRLKQGPLIQSTLASAAKKAAADQPSLDAHLADLRALRDQAVSAGQFGPAISAEMNFGKAAGFYQNIDKDMFDPKALTDAQLQERKNLLKEENS